MQLALVWVEFALLATAIAISGHYLCLYGDAIAEKLELSSAWIGLVLVATVTSLPELVTGVSAVTVADVPDIAIGNILGACVFNLVAIVIADFLHRGESVYTRASRAHILSAGFSSTLIGFVGFNVALGAGNPVPALGHVGAYTPVIALLYGLAVRTVFQYEAGEMRMVTAEVAKRHALLSLPAAAWRCAAASIVVVAAAMRMPYTAASLAAAMGWEQSFVGTALVALATTLPELTVMIAALRLGALDMAIGNLFGSNMFNVLTLGIDDVLFLRGPLFAHVSPIHAVSAFSAVMMTGVAIIGLVYRPKTRVYKTVGWASLFLFSLFLLNMLAIYLYEH